MRKWSKIWMLNFHPDKNKQMRIGRTNIEEKTYTINNDITKISTEKDISVVIEKLSFADHIAEKINKASKLVGLIRRTFTHLVPVVFKVLYTAIMRPHLEYGNQVWYPHHIKDIEALENVQHRATKLVSSLKDLLYEERLRKLDLPTLAYRRSRGDEIKTFKIIIQRYDQEYTEGLFQMRENDMTRGNSKKIFKSRARLNLRKYSFPHRVVNNWNALPEWVVNSKTVFQFESGLNKVWGGQEPKYNYRALSSKLTRLLS